MLRMVWNHAHQNRQWVSPGRVDLSRDFNILLYFIIISIITKMFIFVIKIIIKKEQYENCKGARLGKRWREGL